MNPYQFRVRTSESGMTLINLIALRLNISKKKTKALIDMRGVFVNGQRIWMARNTLKAGDEIDLTTDIAADSGTNINIIKAEYVDSLILFQDNDILIANKPPGIITKGQKSFESILRKQFENTSLAAAHRLDKDTSGCVLFSKHAETRSRVVSLFDTRSIQKTYHAIVNGRISKTELTITKPVKSKHAATHIRIINTNREASHLQIRIETGRTHQIRKHLTAINHPILGDKMYATSRYTLPIERAVPRQMLHAFQIAFTQPMNSKSVRCTAPIPADFQKCLEQYGLN